MKVASKRVQLGGWLADFFGRIKRRRKTVGQRELWLSPIQVRLALKKQQAGFELTPLEKKAIAIGMKAAVEVLDDSSPIGVGLRVISVPGMLASYFSGQPIPDALSGAITSVIGAIQAWGNIPGVFSEATPWERLSPAQKGLYSRAVENAAKGLPVDIVGLVNAGVLGTGDGSKTLADGRAVGGSRGKAFAQSYDENIEAWGEQEARRLETLNRRDTMNGYKSYDFHESLSSEGSTMTTPFQGQLTVTRDGNNLIASLPVQTPNGGHLVVTGTGEMSVALKAARNLLAGKTGDESQIESLASAIAYEAALRDLENVWLHHFNFDDLVGEPVATYAEAMFKAAKRGARGSRQKLHDIREKASVDSTARDADFVIRTLAKRDLVSEDDPVAVVADVIETLVSNHPDAIPFQVQTAKRIDAINTLSEAGIPSAIIAQNQLSEAAQKLLDGGEGESLGGFWDWLMSLFGRSTSAKTDTGAVKKPPVNGGKPPTDDQIQKAKDTAAAIAAANKTPVKTPVQPSTGDKVENAAIDAGKQYVLDHADEIVDGVGNALGNVAVSFFGI